MINLPQRLITLIFVTLLLACEPTNYSQPPLKIAISPWPGYSFALLASELGYLESDRNHTIELHLYDSLNASYIAYEKGNVDGFFSTINEVIASSQMEKNTPTIVLVTNFSNGSDEILAKESITSMGHLRGKRIASDDSFTSMHILNRALEIHGIKRNEVTLVSLDPKEMPHAIESSLVDAAVTHPPFASIIREHAPNSIFDSGEIENEIIDVLSIRSSTLREREDTVNLLIESWIKAHHLYKRNPSRADELLSHHPDFTKSRTISATLSELDLPDYENQSELFEPGGILDSSIANIIEHKNRFSTINYSVDETLIIRR